MAKGKIENWQKILLFVIVGLFALGIVKDLLMKTVVTTVGSSIVGAPISVGRFSLGILTQKVIIKNFKLYNPKGFPDEPLLNLKEVRVDYDIFSLIKGKLHLPLIIVDLTEMSVVRNKDGALNVDSLKIIEESKKEKPATEPAKEEPKSKKESKQLAMQIDLMRLNIDQVVYKDYTKGEPPSVQVFDVGLRDKEFRNITNPAELATVIMAAALSKTAIKSAGVYAAATILGVGFLPAGVAGVLLGKADSVAEYSQSFDKVYDAGMKLIQKIGELKSEDKNSGTIKGKISGADVTLVFTPHENKKISVKVTARQMMIPKDEIAAGVLYQLSEMLK